MSIKQLYAKLPAVLVVVGLAAATPPSAAAQSGVSLVPWVGAYIPTKNEISDIDNALSREADRVNREMFEEAMTVIRAAWAGERFSFSGKHYTFPPPGIPDRGSTVQQLTLVPRPLRAVEVYQAVSSPATLGYVAAQGFHGVFANQHPTKLKPRWDEFGEKAAAAGHDQP